MEISDEQRKQLLAYMWARPYGEVASLIAMLASLSSNKNSVAKPTDNSVVKPTNNKDTVTSKK